jgi:hypothetical protein
MAETHLFRRRLGVEVDDRASTASPIGLSVSILSAAAKGSSRSGCMKTRPMMLETRTRAPFLAW